MADDRKGFLKFLLDLGVEKSDAEAAADRYDKAISELSAKASRAARSSGSSGNLGSDAINALGAGFIDQQVNNLARISTSTGKEILGALKDSASINPIEIIKGVLSAGINGAEALIGDIAELQKELLERVRGAGGYVGTVATEMMDSIREAMITSQEFGVATDDTLAATKSLMEDAERMVVYSDRTISAGMIASLAFTKNSQTILENAEKFRNVGIGLDGAAKSIEEIGLKSIKLGLSAKSTSDTLIKQLDKLNAFGFQNGIKGLGMMVQQAQALKINMESVFTVADKLYDPESAINLAANLQVVGGAVGDLADPIKLMYDATNNVESLQTSIIGAARSLATYNAEQGRFEVTGANLRRAKAMSDALGISMGELTNMAVKGAAKFEAMSQLDMFPKLTDEQKEFVSNIATIKDGKVGFDVPKNMLDKMGLTNVKDGFVGLSDLSDKQILQLQELQKQAADEKPIDIARNQFNETTKILNVATAIYLRLMEDTRKSSVGKTAAQGMEDAAKFMQKFNPSEDNTSQTLKKFVDESITAGKGTAAQIAESIYKSLSPEIKTIVEEAEKRISEAAKNLNIKEKGQELLERGQQFLEKGAEKGKGLINEGLEKMGFDLRVKVDLNSNSALLASMFVDEIDKNPQLKSSLASSIVKSVNDYT